MRFRFLFLCIVSFLVMSCGGDVTHLEDLNGQAPTSEELSPHTTSGETTQNSVKAIQILENKCNTCHNPIDGDKLGGGLLTMTDLAQLLTSGLVVPGNATRSPLYFSITANRMPKSSSAFLSAEEVNTVKTWINDEVSSVGTSTPMIPLNASFNSIQRNILSTRCTICHGGFYGTFARVTLTNYNAIINSPFVPLIVPGDSTNSLLFTSVGTESMPHIYSKLSTEELSSIKDWIDAGALNN